MRSCRLSGLRRTFCKEGKIKNLFLYYSALDSEKDGERSFLDAFYQEFDSRRGEH